MSVKLTLELGTPLSGEEARIFSGLGMFVLALARGDLAASDGRPPADGMPDAREQRLDGPDEDPHDDHAPGDQTWGEREAPVIEEGPVTMPVPGPRRHGIPFRCAAVHVASGERCIGAVDHRGPHRCHESDAGADEWGMN